MKRPYILIGAGGTGSILFPLLYRYLATYYEHREDDYSLTVIDGKEVSASKLGRQLFAGRFAGNPKASALIEQYEADPSVVIAVPRYLGADNIDGIREHSVVLIAADNFPVRMRIQERAQALQDVTIINGGNEMTDGSLQLYVRRDGGDITPPMSQGHPELLVDDERDPAALSCEQIAELPSGEQTIVANAMSATAMLNGLRKVHEWEDRVVTPSAPGTPPHVSELTPVLPEEVFFDLRTFGMRASLRPAADLHS
jgi:molybdopterin/thiamine biosynthesis adenylyltransferase